MSLQVTIRRGDRSYDLSLEPGDYFIGRARTSDVRIPLAVVSSRHLRLQYSESGWTLTDLQSTNGTMIDGAPLSPHEPRAIANTVSATIGEIEIMFAPDTTPTETSMTLTESGVLARQLISDDAADEDFAMVRVKAGPQKGKKFNVETSTFSVGSGAHALINIDGPESVLSIHQDGESFVLLVDIDPERVSVDGEPLAQPRFALGANAKISYEDIQLEFTDPLAEMLKDKEAAAPGVTTDAPTPAQVLEAAAEIADMKKAALESEAAKPTAEGPHWIFLLLAFGLVVAALAGLWYVLTL